MSSKEMRTANHSYSENYPHKSYSPREENTLSPRGEYFIPARRIVYPREGNVWYNHRIEPNAL